MLQALLFELVRRLGCDASEWIAVAAMAWPRLFPAQRQPWASPTDLHPDGRFDDGEGQQWLLAVLNNKPACPPHNRTDFACAGARAAQFCTTLASYEVGSVGRAVVDRSSLLLLSSVLPTQPLQVPDGHPWRAHIRSLQKHCGWPEVVLGEHSAAQFAAALVCAGNFTGQVGGMTMPLTCMCSFQASLLFTLALERAATCVGDFREHSGLADCMFALQTVMRFQVCAGPRAKGPRFERVHSLTARCVPAGSGMGERDCSQAAASAQSHEPQRAQPRQARRHHRPHRLELEREGM